MAGSLSSDARTAVAQAVLDVIGANSFMRTYDGTVPAGVAAVGGGNNLLCQHAAAGVLGVASATGIDVSETNFSNTPASNVGGTATFVDLCTNGGVVKYRVRVPSDGWTFSGAVVGGQAVTPTGLTIPVGNP